MHDRPPFPFLHQVLTGETADVYFLRSQQILSDLSINPEVGFLIFPGRDAYVCGVEAVAQLLRQVGFGGEMLAVREGEFLHRGQPAVILRGHYDAFGVYETAILGTLASCSGWTTAAREVVDAAGPVPVISFGARHLHPNVAPIMDYAAIQGGCATCSTPLGAALAGTTPSGTMAHAYILMLGDTVRAAREFDRVVSPDIPRIVLVDTFQDPAVESVRVADALGDTLHGIRLDTPGERGGVTPALVKEVRARLDSVGHGNVQIIVSGGVTPDRIRGFAAAAAPVSAYGVGSYISSAAPVDFTGDVREIEGQPVAKLGRIPGIPPSPHLDRYEL